MIMNLRNHWYNIGWKLIFPEISHLQVFPPMDFVKHHLSVMMMFVNLFTTIFRCPRKQIEATKSLCRYMQLICATQFRNVVGLELWYVCVQNLKCWKTLHPQRPSIDNEQYLGFISPVTISAKIIPRELVPPWCHWDVPLTDEHFRRYFKSI